MFIFYLFFFNRAFTYHHLLSWHGEQLQLSNHLSVSSVFGLYQLHIWLFRCRSVFVSCFGIEQAARCSRKMTLLSVHRIHHFTIFHSSSNINILVMRSCRAALCFWHTGHHVACCSFATNQGHTVSQAAPGELFKKNNWIFIIEFT